MKLKTVFTALALSLSLASALPAFAAPNAEVKAAKGLENREPVDEGTSFSAGSTVYVWSRINEEMGKKVKHVWKKDGAEIWTATFSIGSPSWRVNSRRPGITAGSYTVDVIAEDGSSLGSVSFTVN